MVEITSIIQAAIELGFPVAITIYLLWYQGRKMDRFAVKLNEVRLGLYVILAKLDVVKEYEGAVAEYKAKQKNGG